MAKVKELITSAPSKSVGVLNGKVNNKAKLKGKFKKSKANKKAIALPPTEHQEQVLPSKRMSDDPAPKQVKWTNRQRVLVFAARGINHRHRHLMEDMKKLMPHHKTESKMERSKNLYVVNEICEMKNCNKCLMFEGRKMKDLYLWMSNVPNGPSAKFLIENRKRRQHSICPGHIIVHLDAEFKLCQSRMYRRLLYTMGELKMTGNCLRGSRPLLSFDPQFSAEPHYTLLKELLTHIFGVPNHHPKSQPFFDHIYTFMILDNRIWFRNYQILSEDGALAEIGPRFVLNPVKIFSGSFGGTTLWDNPKYISPAKFRQSISKKAANKYQNRIEKKAVYEATKPETGYPDIEGSELFKGDAVEKAKEMIKQELKQESEPSADEESENTEPHIPFMMRHPKPEDGPTKENKNEPQAPFMKKHPKPDMAIRRKQLKAKSKAISDQIKKRKQRGGKKSKK